MADKRQVTLTSFIIGNHSYSSNVSEGNVSVCETLEQSEVVDQASDKEHQEVTEDYQDIDEFEDNLDLEEADNNTVHNDDNFDFDLYANDDELDDSDTMETSNDTCTSSSTSTSLSEAKSPNSQKVEVLTKCCRKDNCRKGNKTNFVNCSMSIEFPEICKSHCKGRMPSICTEAGTQFQSVVVWKHHKSSLHKNMP